MSIESEILGQMAGAFEIQQGLDKLAGEVRDYAKSLAPVFGDEPPHRASPKDGEPGDYRDSITVEHVSGQIDTRRVISRDFKAIWIELGSRHMPEYGVFAKTAAYFGGTGPVISEGVQSAQKGLRTELEKLAKLAAVGAAAHELAAQERAVNQARIARSAAFKAARGGRRRH